MHKLYHKTRAVNGLEPRATFVESQDVRNADFNLPLTQAEFSGILRNEFRVPIGRGAFCFLLFPASSVLLRLAGQAVIRYGIDVSTLEQITEKARALPDELQREALHYLSFLLAQQARSDEDREWAQFSAEQLVQQYSEADAVYDQD